MSNENEANQALKSTQQGLRYARWAGHGLGILLLILAVYYLTSGAMDTFTAIKTCYYLLFGVYLNLPFHRISKAWWKITYAGLVLLSVLFVFLMIASVMFAYIAAADRGERLGVPGFEGSLIFLALMQVPVVLFQRHPDLLD